MRFDRDTRGLSSNYRLQSESESEVAGHPPSSAIIAVMAVMAVLTDSPRAPTTVRLFYDHGQESWRPRRIRDVATSARVFLGDCQVSPAETAIAKQLHTRATRRHGMARHNIRRDVPRPLLCHYSTPTCASAFASYLLFLAFVTVAGPPPSEHGAAALAAMP